MKTVCPSCGAIHSAEALFSGEAERKCFRVVTEDMPQCVARWSIEYIALFRPMTGRGLSWKKVLRLLTELKDLINSGYIQRGQNVSRPCDAAIWGVGLEKMVNYPPQRLPLKSHGYLVSVVYDLADEADKRREAADNAAIRNGTARADRAQGDLTRNTMTREQMREIRKKHMGK